MFFVFLTSFAALAYSTQIDVLSCAFWYTSPLLRQALAIVGWTRVPRRIYRGRRKQTARPRSNRRNNRKPDWVVDEIIRLKAFHPKYGHVALANLFNRLHDASRQMTVSKSYVSYTVRGHTLAIAQLRRNIRRKVPLTVERNAVWGMDMTGKLDARGNLHSILGMIDHATRYMMALAALENKSAWTLLGHLCLAIGRYGKPVSVRTDNERCFTSFVFTSALRCFGIRHELTDLGCPWMNGRIERFWGTLKHSLREWSVDNREQLQHALDVFGNWYCCVRPHANLGGATPYEAWHRIDWRRAKPVCVEWFYEWDGLLTGLRIRRK